MFILLNQIFDFAFHVIIFVHISTRNLFFSYLHGSLQWFWCEPQCSHWVSRRASCCRLWSSLWPSANRRMRWAYSYHFFQGESFFVWYFKHPENVLEGFKWCKKNIQGVHRCLPLTKIRQLFPACLALLCRYHELKLRLGLACLLASVELLWSLRRHNNLTLHLRASDTSYYLWYHVSRDSHLTRPHILLISCFRSQD